MFVAVESGDFVNSTKMSDQTYKAVMSCLKEELAFHASKYDTEYEIFRGDAFQVLYRAPEYAYKAALLTKLKLLFAIDSQPVRVSQALVFGKQSISDQTISQNMGDVAIGSGRLLDETKGGALSVVIQERSVNLDAPYNSAISLIQSFLNHHLAGMTQKQAEVVYHYITEQFPEQQTIADKLNMSRQNVAAHLKRGGANLFKQAIEYFEICCMQLKD